MTIARSTIAPWTDGVSPLSHGGMGSLFLQAAERAGIGAWSCDLADDRLIWTNGVYDLFGLPRDQRLDRRQTVRMYDEPSRAAMERLRADAIARRGHFSLDARIIRPDGSPRWMRLTAEVACDNGRPTQIFGLKQDITQEKERWEALRRMAEHDALTGLSSRSVFQTRFLDAPPGAPPIGALVLIDVDGFKQVNDAIGHAAGDACLAAIADRLTRAFPDATMTARIGGDEFALLLPHGASPVAVEARVAALLAAVRMPIVWHDHLLRVSVSAGIAAVTGRDRSDPAATFAAADAALYAAKAAGRNGVRTA